VTLIVIFAALLTSSVDRRTGHEIQRLNQELERRVIERTSELETVNQSLRKEVTERQRAESELKGSEERHRVIVEAASDAVISMDEGGGILLANPATERIFGYDPVELIGKPLTVLMPEFMRKLHETGFRRYLETGERHLNWQGTEVTALRKNGQEFPVEVSFGEMISNGHRVFTGFIRDISEKKRDEDELRKQKEVFQKIFENIPVMIAFFAADGRIELVNPEWESTVGWTLKEIREHNLDIFVELYPDPQYRQTARDYAAAPTGEWTEFKVRTRDGRGVDMSTYAVRLSDGSIVGIGRDITKQKRTHEAMLRLAAIVESSEDAIISKDLNGVIVSWNDGAQHIFGYTEAEVVGQSITIIIPPELQDEETQILRQLRAGERIQHFETVRVTKEGKRVDVSLTMSPIKDSEGRIVGASKIARDITERKQAEKSLRLFRVLVDQSNDAIQVIDPETLRFIDINGRACLDLGYTREELLSMSVYDIDATMDKSMFARVDSELRRSGSTIFEGIYRRKDGSTFPVEVSIKQVQLDRIYRVSVARDITERKRAEAALRTSEGEQHKIASQLEIERARLIEAQAVAKVGSWETEVPSLAITWSEQMHRIFETDPFYFHPMRRSFMELVHPEDRERVDAAFEASIEKGAPSTVEYRIVMADGRVKVLEEHWKAFRDGQGWPARLIGTCQDITERKRVEAELRESEARFRLVADSAPVMIWMSGTDKLCTYFNKPWLDLTGRSVDRELGNGWTEGVNPEDLQRCLDKYIQSFDRREPFRMEYRLRRHDGQFRWVLDTGVPRFNPDGSFAGFIGSCLDVTEQRGSEEQLREAQSELARVTRALDMGELAAAIAHEVNQPLTAIVTNAGFSLRLLKVPSPNLDELRETITAIVNDGMRASTVISRIRGLLTKGAPNRTEMDINQVIQGVTILLRNELMRSRVSLNTELEPDLPRVTGDPVQLQQVLINLIMNAIEATGSSTDRRQEVLIRSAKNPDGVLVQVQDSGPGIDAGLATRVFEPFFTTKAKGIGMGLAISQSIIESHGGRLWTEPSSTGGLFEFTLPTDRAAA
jgi:PAS domain S-box-containing protein